MGLKEKSILLAVIRKNNCTKKQKCGQFKTIVKNAVVKTFEYI